VFSEYKKIKLLKKLKNLKIIFKKIQKVKYNLKKIRKVKYNFLKNSSKT